MTPPPPHIPTLAPRPSPLALPAMLLIVLLSAADMTALAAAMPLIVSGLKNGIDFYAWPFFLYTGVFTLSMPLWGKLAGLTGRMPVLVLGALIYATGAWTGSLSYQFVMVVGSRIVQGIGMGAMLPMALSVIADSDTPAVRPLSVFGSILGTLIGAPIAWWVVQHGSWQTLFQIEQRLGLGLAAWGLLTVWSRRLPSISLARQLDTQLQAARGPFFALFATPATLASLGLVSLTRQADEADAHTLQLPRSPGFVTAALISTLMGAITVSMLVFLPVHLQGVAGLPLRDTVVALVVIGAALLLAQALAVPLPRWIGYRATLRAGLLLAFAGTLAFTLLLGGMPSPWTGIMALAVFGAGQGIAHVGLETYIREGVPPASHGTAMGLFMFGRVIGGPFGTGLVGSLLGAILGLSLLQFDHINLLMGPLHGSDLRAQEFAGFLPLLTIATAAMHWTLAGLAGLTLLLSLVWRPAEPQAPE